MCLILLQGDITFECGHYHYYPEPTPHANVCPFVDCRPVYSYIFRPHTFIPFPCVQCIRQGTYVYEPERDGTPGGPVHHWVRRDGNDNIVGPDSDPSLRVPLEAPESVTGKGYRMPQRVRISELPPGPAPERPPRGTLEASLRRRLKQQLRERNRAEQRRSDADSRGGVRRAEANTQDIKEDIRGAVQLILEKELRDLMKRKTYQDMTEEQVKREAWRIAYAEVNRVLLREMDNMMEETEEILDGDLAMMVERVKKEGVREEVKEEGEDEVKEEVKVKDESE